MIIKLMVRGLGGGPKGTQTVTVLIMSNRHDLQPVWKLTDEPWLRNTRPGRGFTRSGGAVRDNPIRSYVWRVEPTGRLKRLHQLKNGFVLGRRESRIGL